MSTLAGVPLYVYKREDGSTIELQQSWLEDSLTVCPETGQPMERVLQAFGSQKMPSRFYDEGKTQKGSAY